MSTLFIWIIHICMTQKYLILIHYRILPKIHIGKLWSVGSISCWALGGLCRMHRAVCEYCHLVKLRSTTWLDDSLMQPEPPSFLGPAAEGPRLDDKLVSFNIHSWWKAIWRSVKMGLKRLFRWCAQRRREDRRERGSDRRGEAGILGCSEARTRLRKANRAEPQTLTTQSKYHSRCQWDMRAKRKTERKGGGEGSWKIHAWKYMLATVLQSSCKESFYQKEKKSFSGSQNDRFQRVYN